MAALDDLIQGAQGSQLAGGVGADQLAPQGGGGLFGMNPYQQQVALMALSHLGQNLMAYGSRGRIQPQPFPAGALALLQQNQQREQARADQERQLQALAANIENNPNVPPEMRGTLAAMTRAGNMAGVEAAVAQGMKPRMVERNIGGNIVFAPEDGRGPVQPVGRAAEQWAPDPQNPEMMVEQTTGRRLALDETPSQAAARERQRLAAQAQTQRDLQDRADDRADERNIAADRRQRIHLEQQRASQAKARAANLGDDLQKINAPVVGTAIMGVADMLSRYGQVGPDGQFRVRPEGIPGLGPLSSTQVKRALETEEGRANRAIVDRLQNAVVKGEAGLAQTLNETERQQVAALLGGVYTAQDFANAFPRIVAAYNASMRNAFAAAGPDAVSVYRQMPGGVPPVDLDPFRPNYPFGKTFTGGDGKRYKVVGGDPYDPIVVPQ